MAKQRNPAPPRLMWPPYLNEDAYEYRKILIHVLKAPTIKDGIKTSYEKALSHIKTIADAVDVQSSGKFEDTVNNLNKSYERETARNTILTIALPLPNELSDDQTHDWNQETGIIGNVLGAIENQSVSTFVGGGLAGKVGELGLSTLPILGAGAEAFAQSKVSNIVGAVADSTGMRKPLADPGYFQNYMGSQPRTFNMTFDFVPNSSLEALEIMDIILKLKEHSSPSLIPGGVMMLAPNYFDIDLSNKYVSAMASMKGVVLKNISVNYGADGAMQQFPDGQPKYIQMRLTFVERKMRHAGQFRAQTAEDTD